MEVQEIIRKHRESKSNRLNLKMDLRDFPQEIFQLADTLEALDLSGNQLSSLPDELPRLHKLKILFCSDNQFTELPEILGQCPQLEMVGFKANKINHVPDAALGKSLRWLILTDNQISELPSTIGACNRLQKLMLSGNQLRHLPESMSNCQNLELIRIAANRFEALPEFLFTLPRLSWLAYAGNPCSARAENLAHTLNPINEIDWSDLELSDKLGEGASGYIHRALWQQIPARKNEVAVKIFKGNMTSDGLPHLEKTACIAAGAHPNLINVHGKISGHPEQKSGLVMSLVSPAYFNLADPPSLESCTRDIYDKRMNLTLVDALRMASDIASACTQLHDKGIMHGDLYAHNILHNGAGDCLLGDFGAASFYAKNQPELALSLQRIEMRAFGCLLEELLQLCSEPDNSGLISRLHELKEKCMHPTPANRPLFSAIWQDLQMCIELCK